MVISGDVSLTWMLVTGGVPIKSKTNDRVLGVSVKVQLVTVIAHLRLLSDVENAMPLLTIGCPVRKSAYWILTFVEDEIRRKCMNT